VVQLLLLSLLQQDSMAHWHKGGVISSNNLLQHPHLQQDH
jgi:hypothetical protein